MMEPAPKDEGQRHRAAEAARDLGRACSQWLGLGVTFARRAQGTCSTPPQAAWPPPTRSPPNAPA